MYHKFDVTGNLLFTCQSLEFGTNKHGPINIQHRRRDNREVLAVGRIFKSGELMASRGHKASMACEHDCGYLLFSKCRITKVCVLSSRIITQLKIMVVLEYELMTISV